MEARRSYRLDLSGEITLANEGQLTLTGSVINVGLSGVMIHTKVPLEADSHYMVSFQLKPERTMFKSWASLAWCQEHDVGSYLIGLQFERTDSAMHRALADYISARWIDEHLAPGSYGARGN